MLKRFMELLPSLRQAAASRSGSLILEAFPTHEDITTIERNMERLVLLELATIQLQAEDCTVAKAKSIFDYIICTFDLDVIFDLTFL